MYCNCFVNGKPTFRKIKDCQEIAYTPKRSAGFPTLLYFLIDKTEKEGFEPSRRASDLHP